MEILEETLQELSLKREEHIKDYSQEDYEKITQLLLKKHYEYGYGVVINKKLHRNFHYRYGFKDNTFEQFQEYCKELGVNIKNENNMCVKC